jgi:hypothetical protein
VIFQGVDFDGFSHHCEVPGQRSLW